MNRNLATASRVGAGAVVVSLCLVGSAQAGSWVGHRAGSANAAAAQPTVPSQPTDPAQPWDPSNRPGSRDTQQDQGSASSASSFATKATPAQSTGVVLINTELAGGSGAGTGMVITSTGQVLTSYHVVEDSEQIQVTLAATGKVYPATVIGHDESHDVALLQLQGAGDLSTVTLDKQNAAVNDSITAVGNANGQGYLTAVTGTIRELDAAITASNGTGSNAEHLTGLLRTTAPVVAGDSGGPMYDAQGEVVGINTAASQRGPADSYAVPITQAMQIVETIRAGRDSGTVQVGPGAFLGVSMASTQTGSGAMVAGVVSGGAAAKAGISTGSVITNLGGQAITSATSLSKAIATHEPGDRVSVTWHTPAGSTKTTTVTLGESPIN